MKEYLKKIEKTAEGKWKHRLTAWGGALDLCRRKELEIEKILRIKNENDKILSNHKSETSLADISSIYDSEIENIKNIIGSIMDEKHKMDLLIANLLPEEQEFLYLRFEKGYQYEYIAMKTNFSRSSCFRMMSRSIDYFEENADF